MVVGSALLAGCSTHNPLSPGSPGSQTGVQPFLLASAADPRLPAPMLEAAGASAADWAGLRLVSGARLSSSSRIAIDPASHWTQVARDLAANAKLAPPLEARTYALLHAAILDALIASRDSRRGDLPANTVAAGAASVVLTYLYPAASGRIQDEA